ncbi:hypothetical protein CRG98_041195 [Punica granatum]|uniref:Uncharacterized protein n=1 Tax=Punica granatum TaxID=22663 RepID=A0A2I0I346_PUNGR|nr:hypothetical protein CRG98_041195 [Punica granatum]
MPSARGPFPGSARDCDLGVSVDLPESRLGNSAPRGTRKLKIQISRLWTHPSFNIGKFSTTWPRDVQNPKFTVVDSPRRMNSALGHSRMNPGFEGSANEAFHRVREMAIFTTRGRRPSATKVIVSRGSARDQPVRIPAPSAHAKCRHNAQVLEGAPRVLPAWGGSPSLSAGGLEPRGGILPTVSSASSLCQVPGKALHGVQRPKTTGHESKAPYTSSTRNPSAESSLTSTHYFALNSVYVEDHSDQITETILFPRSSPSSTTSSFIAYVTRCGVSFLSPSLLLVAGVSLICKYHYVSSSVVAQLKRNR